jgi:ABC-type Mn2+/Zn2+ transport system permease subunit
MSGLAIDLWTIAIGVLTNVSCALLGCYLVLRRMSLLGDAISHAVLPGIVLMVAIFESRAPLPVFIGAMAVGVITAFLTQSIHQFGGVSQDASMGVVFTGLFALGVVLIKVIPGLDKVDLDVSCVFEGALEYQALDVVGAAGVQIPRAVLILGTTLLVNVLFVGVLWKELKLSAFDPDLASALGFNSTLLFYCLMAMVAGTAVTAFWAVGSILVIAMLIVPGATAHLLADRMGAFVAAAVVVAVIASIGGYVLAYQWDTSASAMMAVVAGAEYLLAAALSPSHGLVARWARQLAMGLRIAGEDLLAALYRVEEHGEGTALPRGDALRAAGGGWRARLGLGLLKQRKLVLAAADGLRLSDLGRGIAARLVRSHRLWESYLAQHSELPGDHLHAPAARMEHFVTPDLEREILAELSDADRDPHGRPIPGQKDSRP